MSTSTRAPREPRHPLLWADEESIEHDARNQLRRVSSLPLVHGVRVMPTSTSARARQSVR